MPSTEGYANKPANNGDQQRSDEEIRWQHEGYAGIAHSAQIQNGDHNQNPHANCYGVLLQRRDGGDQGADPRGNAHGRGKNVVRQQSRRREKSSEGAQVEAGDGIRAAAGRIGGDGLAIGKVDDDQQRNDRRADGDDVLHAEQAKRNQQAERRFRTVSGGTERVQTEDGNTFLDANLFGTLVAGFDGFADNGVENVHEWMSQSVRKFPAFPYVTR